MAGKGAREFLKESPQVILQNKDEIGDFELSYLYVAEGRAHNVGLHKWIRVPRGVCTTKVSFIKLDVL